MARAGHTAFCVDVAEAAAAAFGGPEQPARLVQLDAEYDNLVVTPAPDQAAKRQLLDSSRRDLRRAEANLLSAEQGAEQLDVRLRAAVAEFLIIDQLFSYDVRNLRIYAHKPGPVDGGHR